MVFGRLVALIRLSRLQSSENGSFVLPTLSHTTLVRKLESVKEMDLTISLILSVKSQVGQFIYLQTSARISIRLACNPKNIHISSTTHLSAVMISGQRRKMNPESGDEARLKPYLRIPSNYLSQNITISREQPATKLRILKHVPIR